MKTRPKISVQRAAQVFKEALLCRRDFCRDDQFFKMPDFWDHLCGESETWKVKLVVSDPMGEYQRRAGVVAFGELVTLVVDKELMRLAFGGRGFANFLLAHEVGHLMLGHHDSAKVIKNFKVVDTETGMSVRPPTDEELETNYAAVFLQCGAKLFDKSFSALELARRSYSDTSMVKKAQSLVRLPEFNMELQRSSSPKQRVII